MSAEWMEKNLEDDDIYLKKPKDKDFKIFVQSVTNSNNHWKDSSGNRIQIEL